MTSTITNHGKKCGHLYPQMNGLFFSDWDYLQLNANLPIEAWMHFHRLRVDKFILFKKLNCNFWHGNISKLFKRQKIWLGTRTYNTHFNVEILRTYLNWKQIKRKNIGPNQINYSVKIWITIANSKYNVSLAGSLINHLYKPKVKTSCFSFRFKEKQNHQNKQILVMAQRRRL